MQNSLRAVSYLAPSLLWFYAAIGDALNRRIGVSVQLGQSVFDSLDDPAFQNDEVDIAFVCGLPYTRWNRERPDQFAILGAPVMQAARYMDQPVYFADLIVNAGSDFRQLEDLRGKILCYNDQGSNSGYNLLRGWLFDAGLTGGYFAQTIASGSHQRSIDWVVEGKADCSAIDSTVLEQAFRDRPELTEMIRVCASIGPSPMPPILASNRVGSATIAQMRQALLDPDTPLAEAMARAHVRRFAPMQPEAYAVLGQMRERAIKGGFAAIR